MKYDESPTLSSYKDAMQRCMRLYCPDIPPKELDKILNYSIDKRYKKVRADLNNNYTKNVKQGTLLAFADYIAKRQPIVTSTGALFMRHPECPNPMAQVVQSFLDLRSQYKKQMFKYPKGSEDFEKYNLMQQLAKIDANGYLHVFWCN